MKTIVLQANQIQTAATILKQGGLVVFPTETVYGLGARGDNPEAVQKIFRAKGRPSDNPLILHVASITDVPALVTHISQEAQQLMATFWPGPLTLLFPKSKAVLMDVTAGLSTVAIRMPDHPVARALIEAVGVAVAAPSANVSGRPSSTSFVHVMDDLDGVVEAMIDGGDSVIGIESTVLDVSVSPPVLYRPGAITKVQIETVLKRSISLGTSLNQTKSPGTKYAHYQPQATLTLVLGSKAASMQWLQQSVASTIICPSDWATALTGRNLLLLGHSEEAKSIAQGLYAMLRSLDHNGVQEAVVLLGSKESLGDALVDRLGKAAGGRVKELLG
jgi:L-threonylcarbamoyladenylate synthase